MNRIDGHTQLLGLLGWPVEHSLSPAMHNAALAALGLNWRYVPLPVLPDRLEAAVRGLAALGFRGANVTVPHKQAVLPLLDSVAPNVRALGAANTLVIKQSEEGSASIHGANTDDQGFLAALRAGGFTPGATTHAVVLGAGGAARAVVYGLLQAGCRDIVVLNRTAAHAQALVADLRAAAGPAARLQARPLSAAALVEAARAADLLVQATTTGMRAGNDSLWPEGEPMPANLAVFDLVYTPVRTRLLQQARQSGALAIDGLWMLVQQGILALELWIGARLQREELSQLMHAACQQAREE
jgi:shikimate dehydrogenase